MIFSKSNNSCFDFFHRIKQSSKNRRHFDLVSQYNVGLKTLLLQGLSEPEVYGDLAGCRL